MPFTWRGCIIQWLWSFTDSPWIFMTITQHGECQVSQDKLYQELRKSSRSCCVPTERSHFIMLMIEQIISSFHTDLIIHQSYLRSEINDSIKGWFIQGHEQGATMTENCFKRRPILATVIFYVILCCVTVFIWLWTEHEA